MRHADRTLVRRYATAFLNQDDQLTQDIVDLLSAFSNELKAHKGLLVYAGLHPMDGSRLAMKLLSELFSKGGFKDIFSNLIALLIEHKRLALLPSILLAIYKKYLEQHNIMHFTIESAVPLEEAERDRLLTYLSKKTNKEIQYTLVVNPDLIAGVKMYSDTLGFEHSIQEKLYRLRAV